MGVVPSMEDGQRIQITTTFAHGCHLVRFRENVATRTRHGCSRSSRGNWHNLFTVLLHPSTTFRIHSAFYAKAACLKWKPELSPQHFLVTRK